MKLHTELRVKMGRCDGFIKLSVDRLTNLDVERNRVLKELGKVDADIKNTKLEMEIAQFQYDAIDEKIKRDGVDDDR